MKYQNVSWNRTILVTFNIGLRQVSWYDCWPRDSTMLWPRHSRSWISMIQGIQMDNWKPISIINAWRNQTESTRSTRIKQRGTTTQRAMGNGKQRKSPNSTNFSATWLILTIIDSRKFVEFSLWLSSSWPINQPKEQWEMGNRENRQILPIFLRPDWS